MAKSALSPQQAEPAEPKKRRRLSAAKRRDEMLRGAAVHFANAGFESSTRDIATAIGVTQSLIYKHFASKDDLISQTLQSALGDMSIATESVATRLPLEEMLRGFYKPFVAGATETRMRLFMRASLDGRSWPTKRGDVLTNSLFVPTIAALRKHAELHDIEQTPAMRGERELVMMLHSSMVFLGIRRHIYHMPMPDNLDDIVELYIRNFLEGAVATMRALHSGEDDSLSVELLTRTNGRPAP